MTPQGEIKNIFLVGFMGTGKTSIGKLLAKKLNWSYIDTDTLIEQYNESSIKNIFAKEGEPKFREIETAILQKVLSKNNQVISTGGGIVLKDQNMKLMKQNGIIICLTTSPAIILKRTQSKSHRPVLGDKPTLAKIVNILHQRAPYYAQADLTLDTSYASKKEIIEKIVADLKLVPENTSRGSNLGKQGRG